MLRLPLGVGRGMTPRVCLPCPPASNSPPSPISTPGSGVVEEREDGGDAGTAFAIQDSRRPPRERPVAAAVSDTYDTNKIRARCRDSTSRAPRSLMSDVASSRTKPGAAAARCPRDDDDDDHRHPSGTRLLTAVKRGSPLPMALAFSPEASAYSGHDVIPVGAPNVGICSGRRASNSSVEARRTAKLLRANWPE